MLLERGAEPLSPPVPGSHVVWGPRGGQKPSWPDTVKYRPATFPEYQLLLGAPCPGLDILGLTQIRGLRTIICNTQKK